MTMNIDAEVASNPDASDQPTPLGNPTWGSPLGTGPSVETPCAARSRIQLRAIVPTTATSPPGIALIQRPKTIRIPSTATETASVAPDVCPISSSVSQNLISGPAVRSVATFGAGTPNMPATWP